MMSKIILEHEVDPELNEAYRVFNQNGESGIDAEELMAVMKEFGYNITQEESQDIIDSADWDGDNELNFNEFCMIMMGREN